MATPMGGGQARDAERRVAVFDLDGTVTRSDTYLAFLLRYLRARPQRLIRCIGLPAVLALYAAKLKTNSFVKQQFLAAVFGGVSRAEMERASAVFVKRILADQVRPAALERIRAHREAGDRVVLATASFDVYVDMLAQRLGVDEVVSSRVGWTADGRVSGQLDGANCYGPEKLRRVTAVLGQRPTETVVAYSDSHADLPLLNWADEPYAINPTETLAAIADQTAMPVLDWNSDSAPAPGRSARAA